MRHRLATILTCTLACSLCAPALAQNLPTTPAAAALKTVQHATRAN